VPEEEDEEYTHLRCPLRGRSCADDSTTTRSSEDELRQIEEDRAKAEASAALREQDYQLAYAIDILKGLSALTPAAMEALAAE
jgi:hypothetical protein